MRPEAWIAVGGVAVAVIWLSFMLWLELSHG
jgi:hypothetical protein